MINIYFDESGCIHWNAPKDYSTIAMVIPENKERLKKLHKIFCKKYKKQLLELDIENKMFQNGKFKELKGFCFDVDMKKEFLEFFFQKNALKVMFIRINNRKLTETFCSNSARAFNYIVVRALTYMDNQGMLNDSVYLHIDERNVRTDTINFLQEYAIMELCIAKNNARTIQAKYYDSSSNKLIQIADVLANIYFSNANEFNNNLVDEINTIYRNGYVIKFFEYPPNY